MLARISTLRLFLLVATGAIVAIAANPTWKTKAPAAWTEEEADQILTDSPWGKTVSARISALQTEDQRREGGNMGQEHGVGFDGIADDRPRVQAPKGVLDIVKPESAVQPFGQSIKLALRWESALPIRVAELKVRATGVPTAAEEGYTLAIYGIPDAHFKGGDRVRLGDPLKKQAVLKREGKKDVKPSTVEVFQGTDGLVVVYRFPLSAEITANDGRLELNAQIGRIYIVHSFDLQDMEFRGRLEL